MVSHDKGKGSLVSSVMVQKKTVVNLESFHMLADTTAMRSKTASG